MSAQNEVCPCCGAALGTPCRDTRSIVRAPVRYKLRDLTTMHKNALPRDAVTVLIRIAKEALAARDAPPGKPALDALAALCAALELVEP
jgi:hypothetical protein